MKTTLLLLALLFSQISFAALTRQLTKDDVGLTLSAEAKFLTYTFTEEWEDNEVINLIEIPADARIISVGINGYSMLAAGTCVFNAEQGISGESIKYGELYSTTYFYSLYAALNVKYATAKYVTLKAFGGASTGCTGQSFDVVVQYIQE